MQTVNFTLGAFAGTWHKVILPQYMLTPALFFLHGFIYINDRGFTFQGMKQNAIEGIFPAVVLQVPINCLCMMSPTYKGP